MQIDSAMHFTEPAAESGIQRYYPQPNALEAPLPGSSNVTDIGGTLSCESGTFNPTEYDPA